MLNKTSCFVPAISNEGVMIKLDSVFVDFEVDVLFVFEINAFMHPEQRILKAKTRILYPTYDLSEAQIANFQSLKVTVLRDEDIVKPPSPAMITEIQSAVSRGLPKEPIFIYPAEIKPFKGQLEFLGSLLGHYNDPEFEFLSHIEIVFAGECTLNATYCSSFYQQLSYFPPRPSALAH